MDRRRFLTASVAAALAARLGPSRAGGTEPGPAWPTPPVTARRPVTIEQLGRVRTDDYAWLKDPHWPEVWRDPSTLSAEILAHLEAENRYSQHLLVPSETLQEQLYLEMRRRLAADDSPPAEADGDYRYETRFLPGAEQPTYLRRRAESGAREEVLVDGPARAAGHGYFALAHAAHSPDHRYVAWAEDDTGAEKFRIYVRDLATGQIVPSVIEDAFGTFTFAPDSRWIYWIWRDPRSRPRKLFRRPVAGGEDELVYEEADPGYYMTVARTRSNGYVAIRLLNGHSSEVRLIAADDPAATPRVVEPRAPEVDYDVEHWHDRLVIRTNADGATDFKLMWADPRTPGRASWHELVPHRPGHAIERIVAFRDHLVRLERVDANPALVVTDRAGGGERTIGFEEAAFTIECDAPGDYRGRSLRVAYQSPRQPRRWYDCDLHRDHRQLLKTATIPGGFDPRRYVVERRYATAPDGEQVPVTLLMRRRTRRDGSAPVLLYGYGSYGFSTEAAFSVPALSLVDRGWIYAIAHVRGGGEKGSRWYRSAIRQNKPATFTDFIACAEFLIAAGYTRARRIVAHGLSAGGLLVGAVLNLRPDLWGGVIAQAPFVDMLNTMSDANHPLVPLARPDWGDPLADPAAYDWIAAFSPYENVRPQDYPPVLATTSVADDRVGYWEPAKWIARLRACSTSGRPVLLRSSLRGGHLGATGRFEALRQQALFGAFADWALRATPPAARPGAAAGG